MQCNLGVVVAMIITAIHHRNFKYWCWVFCFVSIPKARRAEILNLASLIEGVQKIWENPVYHFFFSFKHGSVLLSGSRSNTKAKNA